MDEDLMLVLRHTVASEEGGFDAIGEVESLTIGWPTDAALFEFFPPEGAVLAQ